MNADSLPRRHGGGPADQPEPVVIIGAGPGGLTAAHLLVRRGDPVVVLEKDDQVGGISRTARHAGYRFDIGGHRFFTKVRAVQDLWHEILDETEFPRRSRLSRIHYDGRFFAYPLRPANALFGLGPITSLLVLVSYLRARLFPVRPERSFEDWVSNRFGRRLYETFFKTYTEKVWGIPCHRLSADWAAQRIRGLSLVTAVRNALLPRASGREGEVITTLIDSFHYPRLGPGQMWETVAERVRDSGGEIRLRCPVERVAWEGDRVLSVEVATDGGREVVSGRHFVSTMPVRELIAQCDPPPPDAVREAASRLRYRDFLTVALIVDRPELFPDNWIYIHDPEVRVGRVQNFKNWSPDMVPDPSKSCVGLEYFCFEGDGLWTSSDEDLVELAKREMARLGLVDPDEVDEGAVVRMPKAYPVYDDEYADALRVVRGFVGGLANLHLIGRNGLHAYNNQDHSMLTAMLAVENIHGASHDIWQVNTEASHHEEVTREEAASEAARSEAAARAPAPEAARELAATQPRVPRPLPSSPVQAILQRAFARLRPVPFGVALGSVSGLYLFLATAWLVLKGGEVVGPRLALLGQYLPGYDVSWPGAAVGLLHASVVGFALGWLLAAGRNGYLQLYLQWIRRQAEAETLEDA